MLNRVEPYFYALLRLVAGILFAFHGSQKLLGWPPPAAGGGSGSLPPLMRTAGIIELVGGLMIAVGLLTSLAAILASGQMAVAYFMAHAPHSFIPLLNKGELTVLYSFLFLYIAAAGGGRISIDALVGRSRRSTIRDDARLSAQRPAAFGRRDSKEQRRRSTGH